MKGLWGCGFFLLATISYASEPIQNKERFEAEYIKCIKSGFSDSCWIKTLSGHALPWAENEEQVLASNNASYIKWLDGQSVYKVHPGIKEVKAEVFDNRSYVLERDDGAAVAVWISFRQVKGQWYIHEVLGSSDDEFIRTAVGIVRPREK
jgi:hypothetical protein